MNFYQNIKQELIKNENYKRVKDYSKNRSDLKTYYNVGKLLSEAGKKYGEGIIKKYSEKLTYELGKGYSTSNLKNMRKFYIMSKSQTASDLLTWSHYVELLSIENINVISYYIKITEEQNLSVRELRKRIKNNEYERLDDKTKIKLITKETIKVSDFVKNPILIKNKYNKYNKDKITEKILQGLILEDLPSFLKELGKGFSFIENEYKIKIGDSYNYIDMLLFNYIYNCFVVIELKSTELKKEHIGQIETYMNYIDKNIRNINQEKTVGIIICKKGNKFIMEYCSDNRIISRNYVLN